MTDTRIFIVGAMKASTTSLAYALGADKEFYWPAREVHYFYHDSPLSAEQWAKCYADKAEGQICIEKCPTYSIRPESAHLIHAQFPNAKIIFLLRDPLDRALSHYWHAVKTGAEHRGVSEALAHSLSLNYKVPDFLLESAGCSSLDYVGRSRYAPQIRRFSAIFGEENVLRFHNHDLTNRLGHVINSVRCAAGLGPSELYRELPMKNRTVYPAFPALNRVFRREYFGRVLAQSLHRLLRARSPAQLDAEIYSSLRSFLGR